jgi:hypothetical protein
MEKRIFQKCNIKENQNEKTTCSRRRRRQNSQVTAEGRNPFFLTHALSHRKKTIKVIEYDDRLRGLSPDDDKKRLLHPNSLLYS